LISLSTITSVVPNFLPLIAMLIEGRYTLYLLLLGLKAEFIRVQLIRDRITV